MLDTIINSLYHIIFYGGFGLAVFFLLKALISQKNSTLVKYGLLGILFMFGTIIYMEYYDDASVEEPQRITIII